MEITLKEERTKRRACIVGDMWKVLVVSVVLCSMACSTEMNANDSAEASITNSMVCSAEDAGPSNPGACRKRSTEEDEEHNEKRTKMTKIEESNEIKKKTEEEKKKEEEKKEKEEEIAKVLKKWLSIKHDDRNVNIKMNNIEEICKTIKYAQSADNNYMYIELSEFDLEDGSFIACCDIEKALEDIGGILCRNMTICTEESLKLFPLLIKRILVKDTLYIHMKSHYSGSSNLMWTEHDVITYSVEKMLLDIGWKNYAEIPRLKIRDLAGDAINRVFNFAIVRKIRKVSLMKCLSAYNLDFNSVQPVKEFFFTIKEISSIESIKFPEAPIETYAYIKLMQLPNLKNITGLRSLLSSNIVKNLYLDKKCFNILAAAIYREKTGELKEKILQVDNLHLCCVFYTYKVIADASSSAWLHSENIRVYIECCEKCNLSKETNDINHLLKTLKDTGVTYTNTPVVKSLNNHWYDLDSFNCSIEFIKYVGNVDVSKKKMECLFFICSSKIKYKESIPVLNIYLRNSNGIKRTIKKFQEDFDMLHIHINYSTIRVHGADTFEEDMDTLLSTTACMGKIIKVYNLKFYNMKGKIAPNESIPEPIRDFKSTFVLKHLHFYQSKPEYIRKILAAYDYTSGESITIDCGEMDIKDIRDLCGEINRSMFFSVFLHNAGKILEDIYIHNSITWKNMKTGTFLGFGKPQHYLYIYSIISDIFLKKFSLSKEHLSTLVERPKEPKENQTPSKDKYRFSKTQKEKDSDESANTSDCNTDSDDKEEEEEEAEAEAEAVEEEEEEKKMEKNPIYFLIGESISKAYDELKDFTEKIEYITILNIIIANTNPDVSFTTVEDLFAFIQTLRTILYNLKVLLIFNLKFTEEEHKKMGMLDTLIVSQLDTHQLRYIILENYRVFVDKTEELAVDGKEESTKISSKEEARTLSYIIGGSYLNYLVKKTLFNYNVLISHKALLSVMKRNNTISNNNIHTWETDQLLNTKCNSCKNIKQEQTSKSIYIMSRCKHWLCLKCANYWINVQEEKKLGYQQCKWCSIHEYTCFYYIFPSDEEREDITENDINLMYPNYLCNIPME
ncbi:hypothetical protein NEFER03_0790 [Nematocida sp. LUAm3]|nr:hypothetical protein NEFER03_0790 [Nematocida sp. LUAm3]KAI5175249.1 hypothetical protein NEFER02_1210 [Nematocida sp. LUAm2]KAI5179390.1 hypothetical protein NEFER01_2221 [Nematocida sp. LUAm1]